MLLDIKTHHKIVIIKDSVVLANRPMEQRSSRVPLLMIKVTLQGTGIRKVIPTNSAGSTKQTYYYLKTKKKKHPKNPISYHDQKSTPD